MVAEPRRWSSVPAVCPVGQRSRGLPDLSILAVRSGPQFHPMQRSACPTGTPSPWRLR